MKTNCFSVSFLPNDAKSLLVLWLFINKTEFYGIKVSEKRKLFLIVFLHLTNGLIQVACSNGGLFVAIQNQLKVCQIDFVDADQTYKCPRASVGNQRSTNTSICSGKAWMNVGSLLSQLSTVSCCDNWLKCSFDWKLSRGKKKESKKFSVCHVKNITLD